MSGKSFDQRFKMLRGSHARELLNRLYNLRQKVQTGTYNEENLEELASIIRDIRHDFVGNDTRLSEVCGVSSSVIAATYNGRNRPKFFNFMKMLSGAESVCKRELAFPGSQDVNMSNSGDSEFMTRWNADWVRIDRSQKIITDVVGALERLVVFAERSNTKDDDLHSGDQLTLIQKAQLTQVLETALAMLKSPMVEKGFIGKLGRWLAKIGMRTAESSAESALENAAKHGADALSDLIGQI